MSNATMEPPAQAGKPRMKFTINRGKHVQDANPGPDGKVPINPQTGRNLEVMYGQGEVVESEIDLAERFGEKFSRVYDNPQYVGDPEAARKQAEELANQKAVAEAAKKGFATISSSYEKALDRLDQKGLQELAKDVGADLKGLDLKGQRDEVVARIKAAAAG